jgi:hypothetical protein
MKTSKLLVLSSLIFAASSAIADSLPSATGTCVHSTVTAVGQRLVDGSTGNPMPGSGSAINYADGGYQVSYDEVEAVNKSEVGDDVILCLIALPKNCPANDERGKVYATIDLRTMLIWALPDSEHGCGGA